MKISEILALNIRRHRKAKGWTQHDLAAESGVSFAGIQSIEQGKRSPRPDTTQAIAGALGVTESDLFHDHDGVRKKSPTMSDLLDPEKFQHFLEKYVPYEELASKLDKAKESLAVATQTIESGKAYIAELEARVASSSSELRQLNDALESALTQANKKIAEQQRELARISQETMASGMLTADESEIFLGLRQLDGDDRAGVLTFIRAKLRKLQQKAPLKSRRS